MADDHGKTLQEMMDAKKASPGITSGMSLDDRKAVQEAGNVLHKSGVTVDRNFNTGVFQNNTDGSPEQARILADEQKLAERGVKSGDGLATPSPRRGEPPTSIKVASQDASKEMGQAKPEQATGKAQEQSPENLWDRLKHVAVAAGQSLAKEGISHNRGEGEKITQDSKAPSPTPEHGRSPEGRSR